MRKAALIHHSTGFRSLMALCLAIWLIHGSCVPAQEAPGENRKAKPDFRNPVRAYEDITIGDRRFVVEAKLLQK